VLPRRVASDCETCNDLNDIDIVDSVMCLVVVKMFAKAAPAVPFWSGTRAAWRGELGRRVCPGVSRPLLLACFRHQELDRRDDLRDSRRRPWFRLMVISLWNDHHFVICNLKTRCKTLDHVRRRIKNSAGVLSGREGNPLEPAPLPKVPRLLQQSEPVSRS
jgi:hypothetical protein